MSRSRKIEKRVPHPLADCVEDQFRGGAIGNLPYKNHAEFGKSYYLWQAVYGVDHPFTEGYTRLSLEEQDIIHDFIEAEHHAGRVHKGQLVKRLAEEANLTGNEDFLEHGRKLFEALYKLANESR